MTIFGKLTVLRDVKMGRHRVVWCRCECGTEKAIRYDSLKDGRTTSCGCMLKRLRAAQRGRRGLPDGYGAGAFPLQDCWRKSSGESPNEE